MTHQKWCIVQPYKSLPEMTDIFRDEQFLSHYTDNHLNIVGSTTGYEVVHKQFSKEMVRCNILSTACYYFNLNDTPKMVHRSTH